LSEGKQKLLISAKDILALVQSATKRFQSKH